jgi:hypothetical protein
VDDRRNRHRSYLQTPRYTIMVNISVVVLHLMIVIDQDLFRDDG